MKVAIVHEYVMKMGGAERVLKSLLDVYPEADVFSLLYNPKLTNRYFPGVNFKDSGLQKAGLIRKKFFKFSLSRLAQEIEAFDLSGYDLVISSSNSFAHGVVTPVDTLHVSYYHSPARFLWDWNNEYLKEKGWNGWKKFLVDWIRKPVREWDFTAGQRPDVIIANSHHVAKRIKKYYRRDSEVIYPPVNVERFKVSDHVGEYFLIVSTLARYKRIDLAVEAFIKLGKNLKIVGDGDDREYLEKLASGYENIEFLGFKTDAEVAELMSNCKGFIFCSEEDFGITPVEVMASGRPVFGYKKGGLLETVVDDKTGMFFDKQEISVFMEKFNKFENWIESSFKPSHSMERSKEFEEKIFKEKIEEVVNREKKNQVNI